MTQYQHPEPDAAEQLRIIEAHRLCQRLKAQGIKHKLKDGRIAVESRATREQEDAQ